MADEVKVGEIVSTNKPVEQKTTELKEVKQDYKKKSKSREELNQALIEPSQVSDESAKKEEKKLEKPVEGDDFKVKVTSLETELKSKTDRLESMQKVLDKLGTEVGLLRKKTPEQIRELKQKARDLILEEKDDEALSILKGIEQEELSKAEEDWNSKSKSELDKIMQSNKSGLNEMFPDFEKGLSDLSEVMKEDKIGDEQIKKILENPYSLPLDVTYNLRKRADLRKENISLKSELEKLKGEVEELKKKPDTLLRNIANAANRNSLDGKAGSSSDGGNNKLYEINPRKMSKKQLEQELYGT